MSRDKNRGPTFAQQLSSLKKPTTVQNVSGKKVPAIAEEVSVYSDDKAAWRFGHVQLVDPYGWHEINLSVAAKIKARLGELERSTWKDIFVTNAADNHHFEVATLKCPIAKKWMQSNMPGQPSLWTIQVSSRERIWGILAEGAYRIIFWDPLHLIWPVPKKHT